MDSGSTHTTIKKSYFPLGVETTEGTPEQTTTTNGTFRSSESVMLSQVKFPEFCNNNIGDIKVAVFDSPTFQDYSHPFKYISTYN